MYLTLEAGFVELVYKDETIKNSVNDFTIVLKIDGKYKPLVIIL